MIDPFKTGDKNKSIYALLAFALSFLVMLSPSFLAMFRFAIPWFSLLILVGFFMLFFFSMFSDNYDLGWLGKQPVVYGFVIFFVAIIIIFAFANAFGQDLLEAQPGVTDADRIQGDTRPVDEFVPAEDFDSLETGRTGDTAVPTTQANDLGSNIVLTLFHPKILGTLFMLLLATITILLIGRN